MIVDPNALPYIMRVDDVMSLFGISRSSAYTLMHSKDFPLVCIGKSMRVLRDDLLTWLATQHDDDPQTHDDRR